MGTNRFSGLYRFSAIFGGDGQSALSRYITVIWRLCAKKEAVSDVVLSSPRYFLVFPTPPNDILLSSTGKFFEWRNLSGRDDCDFVLTRRTKQTLLLRLERPERLWTTTNENPTVSLEWTERLKGLRSNAVVITCSDPPNLQLNKTFVTYRTFTIQL